MEFLNTFVETWVTMDTIFSLVLAGVILIMLYTMALMHRKIRILENDVQSLQKDQSVMSDELEIVASTHEVDQKISGVK
jgi:hypothetical protein